MTLSFFKKLFNPLVIKLGRKKEENNFTDMPIMIGGCGRSGTTLLLSIIGAHPNIFSFPTEVGTFLEWHDALSLFSTNNKEVPRLDRFYRAILKNKIPENVTRWCEKTPGHVRHFGEILDYFNDNVKLIHLVRDGRDVMLSKHPSNPDEYWVSPKRWVNDVKAGLKYKDHPQVLTIKYEDLILSYDETVEIICDFINEECTEELYSYLNHTNVKDNNAWHNGAKKLHTKSVEKWKKEENKERVEEVMKNDEVKALLKELNYL